MFNHSTVYDDHYFSSFSNPVTTFRAHTGKEFQGLLKTSPNNFQGLKVMKNTDPSVKILLPKS